MPSSACKKSALDRKSTRLNSSHTIISYAVFCLKKNQRPTRGRAPPHTQRATPPRQWTPPPGADRRLGERRRGGCALGGVRRRPFFFLMIRRPPGSTLFPSAPLFR